LVEYQPLSLLPSGTVQMAVVAHALGMSERSFKRHLAQEGTTYGEILDRVRNRLALRYLGGSAYVTATDRLATRLFGNRSVQPCLQNGGRGHRSAEREI